MWNSMQWRIQILTQSSTTSLTFPSFPIFLLLNFPPISCLLATAFPRAFIRISSVYILSFAIAMVYFKIKMTLIANVATISFWLSFVTVTCENVLTLSYYYAV